MEASGFALQKARGRHVPAFGEWNYYYHYDAAEPELPPPPPQSKMLAPEAEAFGDVVWFRYSPRPPRRAAAHKKARAPAEKGRRAPPAKGSSCSRRVVRPVDEDLYQVPPPDFASHRPRRKRAGRSLLMGCFGLNCVA